MGYFDVFFCFLQNEFFLIQNKEGKEGRKQNEFYYEAYCFE